MDSDGGVGVFSKRLCGLPAIADSAPGARITELFGSASPPLPLPQPALTAPSAAGQREEGGQRGFDEFLADALKHWSPTETAAASAAAAAAADDDDDAMDGVAAEWPDGEAWPASSLASTAVGLPFSGGQSLAKIRAGVEAVARLEVRPFSPPPNLPPALPPLALAQTARH